MKTLRSRYKELKELTEANTVALDELSFRLNMLEAYLKVEWDSDNQEYKKLSTKKLAGKTTKSTKAKKEKKAQ